MSHRKDQNRFVLNIALGLLSASFLIGCADGLPTILPKQANVISLDPQNWYFFYGGNLPSHPSADPNGAWAFNFPSWQGDGAVGYVQTPFYATTTLHNVTLTFRIDSDTPQFKVIDPSDILPATVHLFFEQRNDDLQNVNGRWWATASKYDLGSQDNTTITLVIPLTPDQWTNVHGQGNDPTSFYSALDNVGWIGMTFGGQYFFGHGVALSSGAAKYVLVDLSVN